MVLKPLKPILVVLVVVLVLLVVVFVMKTWRKACKAFRSGGVATDVHTRSNIPGGRSGKSGKSPKKELTGDS